MKIQNIRWVQKLKDLLKYQNQSGLGSLDMQEIVMPVVNVDRPVADFSAGAGTTAALVDVIPARPGQSFYITRAQIKGNTAIATGDSSYAIISTVAGASYLIMEQKTKVGDYPNMHVSFVTPLKIDENKAVQFYQSSGSSTVSVSAIVEGYYP